MSVRKIILSTAAMCTLCLCSNPVFAEGLNDVTDSESCSTTLVYEGRSTYTVTVPKSVSLCADSPTVFPIYVVGDIAGDEEIHVKAHDSVELTTVGKDSIQATVSQDKSVWGYADIAGDNPTAASCSVSADGLSAGTWSGTLMFDISLANENALGEDVILTANNLSEYGIIPEGDLVVPQYVRDSEGVKHKVTGMDSVNGRGCFESCKRLTSIVLPDGLTSIGPRAFVGCYKLKSVYIPDTVEDLPTYSFSGCSHLTDVRLSTNLKYFGDNIFEYCNDLTSVTIPSGVTRIGVDILFKSGVTSVVFEAPSEWKAFKPKDLSTVVTTFMFDDPVRNADYLHNDAHMYYLYK